MTRHDRTFRRNVHKTLLFAATLLALSACNSSENTPKNAAVSDDSQKGVITAPQAGTENRPENVNGQPNVTTGSTAASPEPPPSAYGEQPAPTATPDAKAPAQDQNTTK